MRCVGYRSDCVCECVYHRVFLRTSNDSDEGSKRERRTKYVQRRERTRRRWRRVASTQAPIQMDLSSPLSVFVHFVHHRCRSYHAYRCQARLKCYNFVTLLYGSRRNESQILHGREHFLTRLALTHSTDLPLELYGVRTLLHRRATRCFPSRDIGVQDGRSKHTWTHLLT